jgi:hypothetical protein
MVTWGKAGERGKSGEKRDARDHCFYLVELPLAFRSDFPYCR